MPELPPFSRLSIVADLDIEVGDARRSTALHLGQQANGALVLEVPDPVTLRRFVSVKHVTGDVARWLPSDMAAGVPLQVSSRGRNLGWVEGKATGGLRIHPTAAGLWVAAKVATPPRYARYHPAAVAAVGVAAAVGIVMMRRLGRPSP